eukprot:229268_1
MTQPKNTTAKLGKDDIVSILDHREVNGSIDFRIEIKKDETTSIEWISRAGIQHQTFTSGKFKKYFKDTNNTDSLKSFLFELQTDSNCKPEYWIEFPAELFITTNAPTHKGKAVIHDNMTNKEIRNISYERIVEACKGTYAFPEKELDNVCIMYSLDEDNCRNLQKNDKLIYDDIKWEKTEKQGKKTRLLPYKKGKVILQMMTTNYCKQAGMPLSSIITDSKDSNTKKKDDTLIDLEIPNMSMREAMSFITDKQTQSHKETSQENKEQIAVPKKNTKKPPSKPKKSAFDLAMQKYKQEFEQELKAMNETESDTQTQTQSQTQPQTQTQNDLLTSTIGLLTTLISNSNNTLGLSKLNKTLNLNDTLNLNETETKSNDIKTKKNEIKPLFKKGTMGRTICVFDEMVAEGSTLKLLTRCKKKKIVNDGRQLDKEKRKLKFCQVKDIQIDRKDSDVYTKTWSKDNLPINLDTGKPWTFSQAFESDLIGSIDSTKWKVRKTLVIDTRPTQENENKSKTEKKTDE